MAHTYIYLFIIKSSSILRWWSGWIRRYRRSPQILDPSELQGQCRIAIHSDGLLLRGRTGEFFGKKIGDPSTFNTRNAT